MLYCMCVYILYEQLDFLYFWPGPFFVAANGKDRWGPLTNIAAMNFVGLLQGGAGPTLHLTRKVKWEEATCLTHYQGQHYVSSTAKQLQRRCYSSICVVLHHLNREGFSQAGQTKCMNQSVQISSSGSIDIIAAFAHCPSKLLATMSMLSEPIPW